METILLFLLFAAVTLGSTVFSKLCSNTVPGGHRGKYLLYFITFSSVACVELVIR